MNIISLSELLSILTGLKIYAVNFPAYKESEEVTCKLEVISGIEETGGVEEFSIQIMTKAKHPAKAEEVAVHLLETLDMATNKEFAKGNYQLILCKASSPQPYYTGETENHEFVFSSEFRVLVTKI